MSTWKQETGPTLRVVIEVPTSTNGAVFADSTEWRLRHAVHAFLDTFQNLGGRFGDPPSWGARYDYPRWLIDFHSVDDDATDEDDQTG